MRHKYFEETEELTDVEETSVEETTKKVKVITKLLNIRKGPGTNFETTGKLLYQNDEVEITEIVNNFGHLKNADTWISMNYVKMI